MAAGGKIGNKGGGRKKVADIQITIFKNVAWDKIVERVTNKNKDVAEKWLDIYIPMFANKLMPQTIEGKGEDGEIVLKIVDYAKGDYNIPS